jgi:hypothetical protein
MHKIYHVPGELMKKEDALFVLGLVVIVLATIIMVEGSILGDRTTVIAALSGIVGILMVGFASRLRKGKPLF